METQFYKIPQEETDEIKFKLFPRYSKDAMTHFYRAQGENTNLVTPKNDFSKYTYYQRDNSGKGHFCKCKFRVELPSCNEFIIDTNYVDTLKKIVDKRRKELHENVDGQLIYIANNERKIYIIDIDDIDKTNIVKKTVRDTYKDTKKRTGRYYAVNKSLFTVFSMPETIYFCSTENEAEKIIQKNYKDSITPLF